MSTDDIFKRLRIGLALMVGYASGKGLGAWVGHHPSECFIAGFAGGVLLTQWLFYRIGTRRTRP